MKFATDYEWFEYEMAINGLTDRLVSSHVEAASSDKTDNIVYIPDKETGKFDVYLVNKEDGVFTEYVCWVSDEFVEDPNLIYIVLDYILGSYKGEKSVGENLLEMNPNLIFFPYPQEDHADIYKSMKN